MSTYNEIFKEEVFRLARKEIRKHLEPLKKTNGNLRSEVSNLRQRLQELEKQIRKVNAGQPIKDEQPAEAKLRYSTKGLISLRKRLGVSQTELAQLIGVSQNTIHNWEAAKTSPRRSQLIRIAELRTKGKRDIKKLLTEAQ